MCQLPFKSTRHFTFQQYCSPRPPRHPTPKNTLKRDKKNPLSIITFFNISAGEKNNDFHIMFFRVVFAANNFLFTFETLRELTHAHPPENPFAPPSQYARIHWERAPRRPKRYSTHDHLSPETHYPPPSLPIHWWVTINYIVLAPLPRGRRQTSSQRKSTSSLSRPPPPNHPLFFRIFTLSSCVVT